LARFPHDSIEVASDLPCHVVDNRRTDRRDGRSLDRPGARLHNLSGDIPVVRFGVRWQQEGEQNEVRRRELTQSKASRFVGQIRVLAEP
jgi:hypothetical protein